MTLNVSFGVVPSGRGRGFVYNIFHFDHPYLLFIPPTIIYLPLAAASTGGNEKRRNMQNINDLNKALFNRLEAFDNDNLTTEELEMEIQKTEAVVKISDAILKNANLALRAQELFSEYGTGKSIPIPLLGITEGSIERNRKLKGDIQAHGKI